MELPQLLHHVSLELIYQVENVYHVQILMLMDVHLEVQQKLLDVLKDIS